MLEFIKPKSYEYEIAASLSRVQQQLSTVFSRGPLERMAIDDPAFSGFFTDTQQITFIIRTSGGWVHSKTLYRGELHTIDEHITKVTLKSDLMISRYLLLLLMVFALFNGLCYVSKQPLTFWFEQTTWIGLLIATTALFFIRGIFMGLDESLKVSFEKSVLEKISRQT
jgi:hypothetical protein